MNIELRLKLAWSALVCATGQMAIATLFSEKRLPVGVLGALTCYDFELKKLLIENRHRHSLSAVAYAARAAAILSARNAPLPNDRNEPRRTGLPPSP